MSPQERFTISLQQHAGQLVDTVYSKAKYGGPNGAPVGPQPPGGSTNPFDNMPYRPWGVRRQTWCFQNRSQYNIHPKYKRALVFVRAVHMARPTLYRNVTVTNADEDEEPQGPTHSDAHVELDGANDYTHHTILDTGDTPNPTNNLLDYTKDWSFGFQMRGAAWSTVATAPEDDKYLPLVRRGSNAVFLRRGGSNHGFYWTNGVTRTGANTWIPLMGDSRILVTYTASDRKLRYYAKSADVSHGGHIQGATITLTQAQVGAQTPLPDYFTLFQGNESDEAYLDGGLNDVLIAGVTLQGSQISEFFADDEDYHLKEYYPEISSHMTMGEDVHPLLNDVKGNTTGELKNGTPEDFVPSATSEPVEAPEPEAGGELGAVEVSGLKFNDENCYRTPRINIDLDAVMPHNLEMALDTDRIDQVSHNSQRLCTFELRNTNIELEHAKPTTYRAVADTFTGSPETKGIMIDNPFINGGQFYISFSVPTVHARGATEEIVEENGAMAKRNKLIETDSFYTLGPNAYDVLSQLRNANIRTPEDLGRVGLEDSEWTIELDVQLLESDSIGAR